MLMMMNRQELAAYLNVSVRTVDRETGCGHFPHYRRSRQIGGLPDGGSEILYYLPDIMRIIRQTSTLKRKAGDGIASTIAQRRIRRKELLTLVRGLEIMGKDSVVDAIMQSAKDALAVYRATGASSKNKGIEVNYKDISDVHRVGSSILAVLQQPKETVDGILCFLGLLYRGGAEKIQGKSLIKALEETFGIEQTMDEIKGYQSDLIRVFGLDAETRKITGASLISWIEQREANKGGSK